MVSLYINGVEVDVCLMHEAKEVGLSVDKLLCLDGHAVGSSPCIASVISTTELIRLAGFDLNLVEFTIASSLARSLRDDPANYFWYLLPGQPARLVHIGEVLSLVKFQIMRALLATRETGKIKICVRGGNVQYVDGLPSNWDWELIDFDNCLVCGGENPNCREEHPQR